MRGAPSCSRIFSMTVNPSKTGRCRSRSRRSGLVRKTSATAAGPVPASATIS